MADNGVSNDNDGLIGFWRFDTAQSGGRAFGDATITSLGLRLDGHRDYYTLSGDDTAFDLDAGTISVVFSQGDQPHRSADILFNRGEFNDRSKDSYFAIGARGDGAIEILHQSPGARLELATRPGLFDEGDRVEVTYSWSSETGGALLVTNLTTGASERMEFATIGLSFETMDDDGEIFTLGAREVNEHAHSKYFNGTIESVSIYNRPILTERDGIVSGTNGDDLIDINYEGDPDGDRIDNEDAILPGQKPNDDIVRAGNGDDTVRAGLGDDTVFGGNGDDFLQGQSGDDNLFGENGDDTLEGGSGQDSLDGGQGDDTLRGGSGDDVLVGGAGDDLLEGGSGNDVLSGGTGSGLAAGTDRLLGGDDRDLIKDVSAGDFVDGGDGGDDFDTLDLRGSANGGSARVDYTSADKEDGIVTYFDSDGKQTGTLEFQDIEKVIPICFTPGTLIATPQGERPVESLRPGDKVITRDNGIEEIAWVGARGLTGVELAREPHLKPILLRKGSLGNGMPHRDMRLSPNHRVLVSNDKTALYFEEPEVLVAAKHLTALPGVSVADPPWVTYIHFMFEHHEVVLSNGTWTESFQPGDYSLNGVGNAQRLEIQRLFPELQTPVGLASYRAARRSLRKYEAQLLVRS